MAERGQPKARDRYHFMRQLGLVGAAIAMVKDMKEDELSKEFGPEAPQVYLQVVALELAVGRVPDAGSGIASLRDEFGKMAGQPGQAGQQVQFLRVILRQLEAHKLVLEGDYKPAGDELEQTEGRGVGAPLPPEILKFDPKPFVDEKTRRVIPLGDQRG